MSVNLSIKNVPEDVVEQLRQRASANHRSLQGELLTIIEETVRPQTLTPSQAFQRISQLNFSTEEEAARMVREDRDGH